MIAVIVEIHVVEGTQEDFREASMENARASLKEPGVIRFDVLQQIEDSTRFGLIEVYRNEADIASHKETAHYAKWRATVEPWMAEPRKGMKYHTLFPSDADWAKQVCET